MKVIYIQSIIKFRAKLIDKNEWVYGYYLYKYNQHIIYNNEFNKEYIINPNTLSQFKGYEQNHEIYEGDICKNSEGYTHIASRMVIMIEDNHKDIRCTGHGEYHDFNAPYKVIGNVWDTPEKVDSYLQIIADPNSIIKDMVFTKQQKNKPRNIEQENISDHHTIVKFLKDKISDNEIPETGVIFID